MTTPTGCAHARADVRSRGPPGYEAGRVYRHAAGQRGAGLARRGAAARRSPVETRLTRRRPCGGWFATASARRGPTSSFTQHARSLRMPKAIERARSATEAFLYQRLETMPEPPGCSPQRQLPIPFDGRGRMEVDLLPPASASPSRSTAVSTWAMPTPIAAIGAKTFSCRKTATSSCDSSLKTPASASTRFSTRSCAHLPGDAAVQTKRKTTPRPTGDG